MTAMVSILHYGDAQIDCVRLDAWLFLSPCENIPLWEKMVPVFASTTPRVGSKVTGSTGIILPENMA